MPQISLVFHFGLLRLEGGLLLLLESLFVLEEVEEEEDEELLLLLLLELLLLLLTDALSSPSLEELSESLDELPLLCFKGCSFLCIFRAFTRACAFMFFFNIVVLESLCTYFRFPVHW